MGGKNPKTTGVNLGQKMKRRRFKESFNKPLEQDRVNTDVQITVLIFPFCGEKKYHRSDCYFLMTFSHHGTRGHVPAGPEHWLPPSRGTGEVTP